MHLQQELTSAHEMKDVKLAEIQRQMEHQTATLQAAFDKKVSHVCLVYLISVYIATAVVYNDTTKSAAVSEGSSSSRLTSTASYQAFICLITYPICPHCGRGGVS